MLGFRPQGGDGGAAGAAAGGAAAVSAQDAADLAPVDAALRAYEGAWDRFVDSWLVVRVGDAGWVRAWRLQAEQAMRASGKTGMSDEAVADFVSRYLPAYGAYLPSLYAQGPTTARAGRTLVVEVDARRSPVAEQKPLPPNLLL
jgi:D-glycerate 3-kinase